MQTGIRLIGNGQAPVHRYWERILGLVRRRQIDPLAMVTHRVRLEDIEKLYSMFDKRQHGIQKVFIQTQHSAAPAAGTPALTEL
jgi:threonine dehydrogenase-like Zn-dependent dehydrogenase